MADALAARGAMIIAARALTGARIAAVARPLTMAAAIKTIIGTSPDLRAGSCARSLSQDHVTKVYASLTGSFRSIIFRRTPPRLLHNQRFRGRVNSSAARFVPPPSVFRVVRRVPARR
ncbi:hypothetical protein MRA01_61490 [Methylobacterium radiotolerans]|nr:hypothetical protein MRA01_61490 [Methylobacterium radiotolerans]